MYQYIICTSILYVPVYYMYQYIICTSILYVPVYYMAHLVIQQIEDVSKKLTEVRTFIQ